MRGGADWPRIELRYELVADGKTLKSGTERLSDMNYLQTAGLNPVYGSHGYEERMLGRWFAHNFDAAQ